VGALTSDQTFLKHCQSVERAWLEACHAQGIQSSATQASLESFEITSGLVERIAQNVWKAGNPGVAFVSEVEATLSDDALQEGVFHRGLTSQDIVDTAMMMMAQQVLSEIRSDLIGISADLAQKATKFADSVCLTRTLTRGAQPSLLGFRFAMWGSGVLDAMDAVETEQARLPLQIGGAVGNRAAIAELAADIGVEGLLRHAATQLGLFVNPSSWHINRIPVLRVSHALAATSAALGVMAHNLVALGRPEIGELIEDVPDGQGGSSAMPHKKNPIRSILAHSVSQRVPSLVSQIQASATAVMERGEGQWNAEWEPLRELMRLVAGQAHHIRAVLGSLRVEEDAVSANLAAAGLGQTELSKQAIAYMNTERERITAELLSRGEGSGR
jgi:3-carboxy-cis,cis-muconate cycloisomerase